MLTKVTQSTGNFSNTYWNDAQLNEAAINPLKLVFPQQNPKFVKMGLINLNDRKLDSPDKNPVFVIMKVPGS